MTFFSQKYGAHRVIIANSVVTNYIVVTMETRFAKWVRSYDVRYTRPEEVGRRISALLGILDGDEITQEDALRFERDFSLWTDPEAWPTNILPFRRE